MAFPRKWLAPLVSALLLASCATTAPNPPPTETETPEIPAPTEGGGADADEADAGEPSGGGSAEPEEEKEERISLLFAGDVMAHEENFGGGRFDRIWAHVEGYIRSADLAFANVEAPVMDGRRWQAYPTFNMHTDYVEQAISAGFRAFSLANNHTNDQGLAGIASTRDWFAARSGVWACGLKRRAGDPLTHRVIEAEAGGSKWRILFVAVTELLNRPDHKEFIDYYPSTAASRASLKESIARLRRENPCDLAVVSVHTDEPEYVLAVTDDHRRFFRELAESGADVVWANHPHVAKPWEVVEAGGRRALVMYANGNTVSGQRRDPQFSRPETLRDYTGEGIFVRAEFVRKGGGISLDQLGARLVTTLIAPDGRYVLRFLDDELLGSLDAAENLRWRDYLAARRRLMEAQIPALAPAQAQKLTEEGSR